MPIISFLLGVLVTWLIMSGLLTQGFALLVRIWWPSASRERELKVDQWLLNNTSEPSSSWNLLGYWKDTSQYRQACSEMAGLLADKSCISSQDSVLDIGFTSHDQLRIWLDYYQVNQLTAISSEEHQIVNALEACGQFSNLKLLRGSETSLDQVPAGSIDKLLALDCVYRFKKRQVFFSHARNVLRPEGTLAFTDMVLSRPFRDRREQRLINFFGRISGVMTEDMPVKENYQNILNQQGFEQVDILDITDDVLSGFCFWFGQHYQELSSLTRSKMWIRLTLKTWFIRWMLHRQQLKYITIVAR
ncbi:methyltransferase domain-containing protein [Endozoicomonas ascidiicola]|uniref:methyltransferase domain-containing protein n=1 Tax=Endozoicomonas ascidiicola TaxID=1698521 RepID=UPI000829FA74|nr:methyltransferase domain-containing protein [Endozoicomonas ascidiicola]